LRFAHFGRDGMIQDMEKSFRGTRASEIFN
jgi:hypothetical protein